MNPLRLAEYTRLPHGAQMNSRIGIRAMLGRFLRQLRDLPEDSKWFPNIILYLNSPLKYQFRDLVECNPGWSSLDHPVHSAEVDGVGAEAAVETIDRSRKSDPPPLGGEQWKRRRAIRNQIVQRNCDLGRPVASRPPAP